MPLARLEDLEIAYDVHGPDDGEPVVLVMGLATQLVGWPMPLVERLVERGHRVVRLDNRDIGASTRFAGATPTRQQLLAALASRRLARSAYLLSDMAGDVLGLLDHLGLASAHVVGASMGGMIAQELAIGHPGRVRSLTSIMANTGDRRNGLVSPRLLPRLRRTLLAPPPTTREELIAQGVEAYAQIGGPHVDRDELREMVTAAADRSLDTTGRLRQLLAISASPDRTPALRRLRVPTLVIHGMLDPLVTMSGGVATARAVPGSRLLLLPDMGHDLPGPRRGEIADAIADHAARAVAGASARG